MFSPSNTPAPLYSEHERHSSIISSTKLLYVTILIGEPNTGKLVYSRAAVPVQTVKPFYAEAYCNTKGKSIKMLTFFGLPILTLGNLSKGIVWVKRIKMVSSEELH